MTRGEERLVTGMTEGGGARDASALLLGGQVVATCYKRRLPNYGVFDERRYFVPGDSFTLVRAFGVDIGLTVCEDLWQDGGPFAVARAAGVTTLSLMRSAVKLVTWPMPPPPVRNLRPCLSR